MINTLVRIMFMIMRAIYVTTGSSQKNSIVASIVAWWCVRFASHHIDFWPHRSQWGDIISEGELLFPTTSP